MSCESNRDLLELYALGVLEPDERTEVEEHLRAKCENWTAALKQARALNSVLIASLPLEQPSPGLRSRVVRLTSARDTPSRASVGWIALAAGLMGLTIWLGVDNLRTAEELEAAKAEVQNTRTESAELARALDFLRDPETRPASTTPGPAAPRGTYFVNPRSGVLLIASNLPAPAPGRAYSMWVIPKGQAPVPAGIFRPDANGSAIHLQPGPVDLANAEALAITDEPESGSPAPTTQPFLVTPAQGE